jgi:hypothetical protein
MTGSRILDIGRQIGAIRRRSQRPRASSVPSASSRWSQNRRNGSSQLSTSRSDSASRA